MAGSISIVSAGAAGLNPAGIGENHHMCLQCFDAVVLAAGRASGL